MGTSNSCYRSVTHKGQVPKVTTPLANYPICSYTRMNAYLGVLGDRRVHKGGAASRRGALKNRGAATSLRDRTGSVDRVNRAKWTHVHGRLPTCWLVKLAVTIDQRWSELTPCERFAMQSSTVRSNLFEVFACSIGRARIEDANWQSKNFVGDSYWLPQIGIVRYHRCGLVVPLKSIQK